MSYLATNLKQLRKTKNLTQTQLAEKIGIKRAILGAYEEGRAEPKLSTLQMFCRFFNLSLDDFVNNDLSSGNIQTKITEQSLRVLPISIDKSNDKELVSMIPEKASAGYTRGYADADYIREMPHFSLPYPEISRYKTHRVFQIQGDSMLPILPGSYIIGQYVENWRDVKNDECYIILSKNEGIVFKRILNNLVQNGSITLKSDNPAYPSYTLPIEEIMEVWRAVGYTSFDFPETHNGSNDIKEIYNVLYDLKREVNELKKQR